MRKNKKSSQRTLTLQTKEPVAEGRPPKSDEEDEAPVGTEAQPATEQYTMIFYSICISIISRCFILEVKKITIWLNQSLKAYGKQHMCQRF